MEQEGGQHLDAGDGALVLLCHLPISVTLTLTIKAAQLKSVHWAHTGNAKIFFGMSCCKDQMMQYMFKEFGDFNTPYKQKDAYLLTMGQQQHACIQEKTRCCYHND